MQIDEIRGIQNLVNFKKNKYYEFSLEHQKNKINNLKEKFEKERELSNLELEISK